MATPENTPATPLNVGLEMVKGVSKGRNLCFICRI